MFARKCKLYRSELRVPFRFGFIALARNLFRLILLSPTSFSQEVFMQFYIDTYFPDDIHAIGDAGMAGFEEKRPLYIAGCKNFLLHYRAEIRTLHTAGASGTEITNLLSDMMDTLINKLFFSILDDLDNSRGLMEHVSLVAVGGYGRGELNPFSDIDIMFLHNGSVPVAHIENLSLIHI